MKKLIFIAISAFLLNSMVLQSQGLKAFQLSNGLKVFIWEDENMADVTGMVATNKL